MLKRGSVDPKFQVEGVAPTNNFCTVSYANECLTTLLLTVFTQRNFVADFLQAKCIFNRNRPFCVFGAPLGDLGATYDLPRLIGKRVVGFLLALIELFSLGVTACLLYTSPSPRDGLLSRTVSELSQLIAQISDTAFLNHPLGGGLMDNIRYSSWAHWKARSGLPISVN